MDAMTYLDLLARRARLEEAAAAGGPLDRFAARVWWKVAAVRYRTLAAADPVPLWHVLGGAAAAAGLLLAWSYSAWDALREEAAAPSFVNDLFTWL